MFFPPTVSKAVLAAVLLLAPIVAAGPAHAQATIEIQLSYKDKTFDPAEIGGLIAHLCRDEAFGITGEDITVAGGSAW